MIAKSDVSVEEVLQFFTNMSIDVTFLVPTVTGFRKSIMDATGSVRSFLVRNKIHDYSRQGQGQEKKVLVKSFFVKDQVFVESYASLYRPETKNGDPRIWFKGLKEYCQPNNLLSLVAYDGEIYVFNMSNDFVRTSIGLKQTAKSNSNYPSVAENNVAAYGVGNDILWRIMQRNAIISTELLEKMKAIYRLGFVQSIIHGDTGVGMTLENLLGIQANSSKNPDYKGIEIKASRMKEKIGQQNRVNLFSQAPEWSKSMYTAKQLLDQFGYLKEGRMQLYCTVTANKPNPQSLYFAIEDDMDALFGMGTVNNSKQRLVTWDFELLRERLESKHKETFWVKATSAMQSGIEFFQYEKVIHTRKPNSALFSTLMDSGIITMDYTLSEKNNRVRDHGYLFKIRPENVPMLFPDPISYDLGK